MTYGAKESNPQEGMGLAMLFLGMMSLTAGWAYEGGLIQPILILLKGAKLKATVRMPVFKIRLGLLRKRSPL